MKHIILVLFAVGLVACADVSYIWKQQFPTGTAPSPRYDFSYAYDPATSNLIIYGGISDSGISLNDLFLYNTAGNAWAQVSATSTWPTARHDAAAIWANGAFYLVGGADVKGNIFNDVWSWTFANGWSNLGSYDDVQRSAAAIAYIPALNSLYSFGGSTPSANFTSDLDSFTVGSNAWNVLNIPGGPSGRQWSTLVYAPYTNSLVVFGGYNGADLRDLFLLELDANYWHGVKPQAKWPQSRSDHSAVYNSADGEVLVFGGESSGEGLNDLWTLSHDSTPVFTQLTPAGSVPGRYGSCLVEAKKGLFVTFGGRTASAGANLNDIWTLSVPTSSSAAVSWVSVLALSVIMALAAL